MIFWSKKSLKHMERFLNIVTRSLKMIIFDSVWLIKSEIICLCFCHCIFHDIYKKYNLSAMFGPSIPNLWIPCTFVRSIWSVADLWICVSVRSIWFTWMRIWVMWHIHIHCVSCWFTESLWSLYPIYQRIMVTAEIICAFCTMCACAERILFKPTSLIRILNNFFIKFVCFHQSIIY